MARIWIVHNFVLAEKFDQLTLSTLLRIHFLCMNMSMYLNIKKTFLTSILGDITGLVYICKYPYLNPYMYYI